MEDDSREKEGPYFPFIDLAVESYSVAQKD